MLNRFFGSVSKDIGIDLGTANTLVYVRDRGIVINEPSVVAVNTLTDQILAVGQDAKAMIGKTPAHIVASRPLVNGVVSDFEVTEKMLKHFIDKVHRESFSILPRPRVVIAIPLGVTEVERKAVEDAAKNAGAKEVILIEEPMAAAIGSRLPVQESTGTMIVDIGGGTTEIAVIALGGVVNSRSLRTAGDDFNQDIINFCRDEFNLLIGERTAELAKIQLGSALPLAEELELMIRGRDLITGLPRELALSSRHIRAALDKTLNLLIENICSTIETTPPELVADIYERGIMLTGGGALLKRLDERIEAATNIPVHVVDDPLTAVARGTGIVLDNLDQLKKSILFTTNA
ncbi:MAG TPA: rod shape-determining protein [Candidatus Kerfeldbacteria bacterium]|nr:rod shape-determining protein [Candidatus Kerfeldbacteria bacterium]